MENKLNLPPFYIGQKVEYITGIKMAKGSIHTVHDVHKFACGCYGISITPNTTYKELPSGKIFWKCDECLKVFHDPTPQKNTWSAKSFHAIQEQKFPLMSFKKVIEKERELVSEN